MAEPAQIIALLNLLSVEGIGSGTAIKLVEECGSAAAVFDASDTKLWAIRGITDRIITPLRKAAADADTGKRRYEAAMKHTVEIRTYWDEDYPKPLKAIEGDAPAVLFIRGRLAGEAKRISVVGTRRATPYGKKAADEIIGGLRGSDIHLVSGMASGIDGFAHEAALDSGLVTEAVFGNGVDIVYPPSNEKLARRILESDGAFLSEYPMGAKATKYTFPQRNRIIAGLSRLTIVVEAPVQSGAQITAGLAIEYGREVGAVPGPVHSGMSRGTHELIKTGAALIESAEDILALLQDTGVNARTTMPDQPKIIPEDLPPEEKRILTTLSGADAVHIDDLAEKVSLSTGDLLSRLLMLELKGHIQQLPGKYFVRA